MSAQPLCGNRFKRNPLMEAFTLGGWAAIVASAVLAAAKGNLVLSTVLLGCSNTVVKARA